MAKIVVGMSGGVDSAVSALLLKNQGHEVIGVFMRNWDSAANRDVLGNPDANAEMCPQERDWKDVQALGKQLGIKVLRADFVAEYWDHVFKNLIAEYKAGRTPNPDIWCNRYIKFGVFFDWVFKNIEGVDYIATGHYAKIDHGQLVTPLDSSKDQTYFLAQVKAEQFKRTMFPLADMLKTQVREIAAKNNLIVATKRDSTGVCFVGEREFTRFLQNYIPAKPGPIVDITTKAVVGRHSGAMYYTIGKRQGIGLSGMTEPYYVCGNNLTKRTVYVAPQSRPEFLVSHEALITDVNWLSRNKTNFNNLTVKFRYRSESVKCEIEWVDDLTLRIKYPQGFSAVTPGQQAVFYDGTLCLGGGVIDKTMRIKTNLLNNRTANTLSTTI